MLRQMSQSTTPPIQPIHFPNYPAQMIMNTTSTFLSPQLDPNPPLPWIHLYNCMTAFPYFHHQIYTSAQALARCNRFERSSLYSGLLQRLSMKAR
ncbi:hypothetical protein C8R48DRAFT_78348 [Suillus tomentosus]|nr:hypothetical protein C8R48DRAFT_78348 [Suillus tomentosus]